MKITFPHLGNAYIAIESLLRGWGHEPITPPPTSRRTLELGTCYGPAEVCLPFKIVLGNMLEGIELGAEAVLMIGGWGPCRLGYYGEIQKLILQASGKKVEFITLEVPRGSYRRYYDQYRRLVAPKSLRAFIHGSLLSWAKLKAVEELEELALRARPREKRKGATNQYLARQLGLLRLADTLPKVKEILLQARREFERLEKPEPARLLRLGVVGEIYTVVEGFANLRLEERLGNLGVEVIRTISLSGWINDHVFKNAVGLYSQAPLRRLARGYLRGFIGGHGLESVARSAGLSRLGVDGVVHILPLSCMPEVVAQGILPSLSRDLDIPVLSLVVDEHTSEVGFQTRLEAFVDLVERRVELNGRERQTSLLGS